MKVSGSQTLLQLHQSIAQFKVRKKWYRRFCNHSAVALILKENAAGLDVLMIKRAERGGDPWSGHMAFPGGKMEPVDLNSFMTARRETLEEIGFDIESHGQCMGRLSDVRARPWLGRRPMVITPYLFHLDDVPAMTLNDEVADVVWVPLTFLADAGNRQTMTWKRKKNLVTLPCYIYQQQKIWGLSLMMLDELLALIKP